MNEKYDYFEDEDFYEEDDVYKKPRVDLKALLNELKNDNEKGERAEKITEVIGAFGETGFACVAGAFAMICLIAILAIPCVVLLEDLLDILIPGQQYIHAARTSTICVLVAISTGAFGLVAGVLSELCEERNCNNGVTLELIRWMYRLDLSLLPLLLLSTINDSIITSFFSGEIEIIFDINLTVMVMAVVLLILAVFLKYTYEKLKPIFELIDCMKREEFWKEAEEDTKSGTENEPEENAESGGAKGTEESSEDSTANEAEKDVEDSTANEAEKDAESDAANETEENVESDAAQEGEESTESMHL